MAKHRRMIVSMKLNQDEFIGDDCARHLQYRLIYFTSENGDG